LYRINNVTDTYEDLENNTDSSNDITPINQTRINELQTPVNKLRRNTASAYLSKCQAVLDIYISERNNEKQHNESI